MNGTAVRRGVIWDIEPIIESYGLEPQEFNAVYHELQQIADMVVYLHSEKSEWNERLYQLIKAKIYCWLFVPEDTDEIFDIIDAWIDREEVKGRK